MATAAAGDIAAVLDQRSRFAGQLVDRLEAIDQLSAAVERARFALETLASGPEVETHAALAAARRYSAICSEALDTERDATQTLARRFSRRTLNVGAVGRARMGKSRFLQSLTGLTSAEIPDSDGGFTTGAPSVIHHGRQFEARAFFMSKSQYWAQIQKYYREIDLRPVPQGLEEFWAQLVPALPPANAEKHEAYKHLKRHWEAKGVVKAHLGRPPASVPRAEISDYVTQDSDTFRALDRLEITVDYPAGLEQVGVIDLPGMGDTNVTDIDRLLVALRDDIDVVMVIRLPAATGDAWRSEDIQLYARAEEALPSLPMPERSVLVLNLHRTQGNRKQAELMLETATSEDATFRTRLARIVDVSDEQEVRSLFGDVINELSTAVAAGDALLMSQRDAELARVASAVEAYVGAARAVVGAATPISLYERTRLAHEARADVMQALRRLLADIKDSVDTGDDQLGDCFEESLRGARDLLGHTTVEEFDRRAATSSRANAYNDLLDETRTRLGSHFAELEPELRRSLDRERDRVVATILAEGHLRPLVRGRTSDLLSSLRERFEDPYLGLPGESNLREALRVIADAELTYRGFLQHRVRHCLRRLDADNPLYPVAEFAVDEYDVSNVPTQRFLDAVEQTGLSALFGDDVDGNGEPVTVEGLFKRVQYEPGRASFSVVEEFVDRVTRGELADLEWDTIYRNYLPEIFPDSFQEAQARDADLATVSADLDLIVELQKKLRPDADAAPTSGGETGVAL